MLLPSDSVKAITWRITSNLIIGIIVTFVTVGGAIYWMARNQNEQAAEATRTMVLGGLGGLEEYIQQFANDYAWWEAGYDAYIAGDREWVDENYGSGIIDTQISDLIFIISTTTREIDYDWAIEDIPTPVKEVFTEDVIEDIFALRVGMPHAHDAARSGYVLDGDGIILMAFNRITPVSRVPDVDPDSLALLVQGIYLSEERLTEMGQQFLIDDVHLYVGEPTSDILNGNFPLIQDMDGNTIGALVWTPPTPGYAVLRSVALPIGIALALFTIIAIATAFRAGRIANDLASEKEKIDTVVSSIGEGVLVVDADGKVFLCNQFGGLLLGLTQEEILGKTLAEIFQVPAETGGREVPIASILDVISARKTVKLPEVTFSRLDGNIIILSIVATPVELANVFIGGVVVFHDVTEQKLIDTAKQQFISIAAHQLRTPLSGIKWAISLLVDDSSGPPKEDQKAILTKSYESVNQLVELVNDLLNVDRIESGRMEFSFSPVHIADFLQSILVDVTAQAERKDIRLELKAEPNLPELKIDKGSMRIVFQNLLENAIRYTPAKGLISVRIVPEGSGIRISVKDSGIGIPHSQQKSIFGRFFRATNAVLVQPDGSGLGLYIVKQIVERHKGKVWFDSEEGKGTTFHIALPLDRAHSEFA